MDGFQAIEPHGDRGCCCRKPILIVVAKVSARVFDSRAAVGVSTLSQPTSICPSHRPPVRTAPAGVLLSGAFNSTRIGSDLSTGVRCPQTHKRPVSLNR